MGWFSCHGELRALILISVIDVHFVTHLLKSRIIFFCLSVTALYFRHNWNNNSYTMYVYNLNG